MVLLDFYNKEVLFLTIAVHAVYVVSEDIFMRFGLLICFQNRFRNDFDIPLLNFELNVDLIGILHSYPSTLRIRNLYPVLNSKKILEFLSVHFLSINIKNTNFKFCKMFSAT